MMPLAPTSRIAMPTCKPKIGFSIDSIVGSAIKLNQFSSGSECSERPNSPLSDCSYPAASSELNACIRNQMSISSHTNLYGSRKMPSPKSHRIRRHSNSSDSINDIKRNHNRTTGSPDPIKSPSDNGGLSPDHRLSPDEKCLRPESRSPSPCLMHGGGSVVKPFPITTNELKTLPAYMMTDSLPPDIMSPHPNSHFLAAQFQMAAALAHGQAAVAASGGQGLPGAVFPPHHPHYVNQNIQRDSYTLYPWLLSRHGRIFPNRFPSSK